MAMKYFEIEIIYKEIRVMSLPTKVLSLLYCFLAFIDALMKCFGKICFFTARNMKLSRNIVKT
jgi:hypothetical protein